MDQHGKKHWIRGYKNYRLEHRYYDKVTVRNQYHPEQYKIDTRCRSKTDTSIDCDSIKLFVLKDSWLFAPLFTTGLVPCRLVSKEYGSLNDLPGVEKIPGKELKDTGIKNLIVYDVHQLKYIRHGRGHRVYQFHVMPYWFYIELINKKSRKKTKFPDFLKGAQLNWLYKSNVIDI